MQYNFLHHYVLYTALLLKTKLFYNSHVLPNYQFKNYFKEAKSEMASLDYTSMTLFKY